MTELWFRVSQAGGAAGFAASDTVEDIRAVAVGMLADVRDGRADMLTLSDGDTVLGVAVIEPGQRPIRRHSGELTWLMVDPDLQGQGWGAKLLGAAVAHARAIGLVRLELHTRSGHGLERFYSSQGWTERGRWPGAVRLAEDDERDEIWFTREI
ncbi:GNAT family N-acetyltransferase [Kutzneria sp. CA-103260]|uniref:GNAT family N-acetyltransferase n=1 Tax=Kutzneria sp. CA-103260 TaxID=2802641 RepID=UPI001BEFD627|nr:GNAT family N-acetyltransferase [Kutzneria sp. CA-103260]QUQ68081.1 acetyltransferase [Kutzneria sp. CA-103260]